jgi:hypothetical protein
MRCRSVSAPDPLLDHLVCGGQQRFRDGKAESIGRVEIDDELELGGPHDRRIVGDATAPERPKA